MFVRLGEEAYRVLSGVFFPLFGSRQGSGNY